MYGLCAHKIMVFKQNSTNQWVMWLLPSVIYSLTFTVHHSEFTLLLSDSSGGSDTGDAESLDSITEGLRPHG